MEPEVGACFEDDYISFHPPPPLPCLNTETHLRPMSVEPEKVSSEKMKSIALIDESQMPKAKRGRRRRFIVDPKEEIKAIKAKKTKGSTVNKKKSSQKEPLERDENNSCGDNSDEGDGESEESYEYNKNSEDSDNCGSKTQNCTEKSSARENIKKKRNREAAQQFRLRQKIYIKDLEEKLRQGETTQLDLIEGIKRYERINNVLRTQIAESQNFITSLIPLIRWNYEAMFPIETQNLVPEQQPQQQQQQQQQENSFPMEAFEGVDIVNLEDNKKE